jgi:hypothetical protein
MASEGAASQSGTVASRPAWGIAQANELMASLAGADNDDLVVRVVRTTLESVGVHVGELIAEANTREGELRTQIDRRRATIADLERQIESERSAITGLEGELALTGRTRNGLERSETRGQGRASRASDRPTVMAVSKGLGENVLSDADVQSLPPDEPVWPTSPATKV